MVCAGDCVRSVPASIRRATCRYASLRFWNAVACRHRGRLWRAQFHCQQPWLAFLGSDRLLGADELVRYARPYERPRPVWARRRAVPVMNLLKKNIRRPAIFVTLKIRWKNAARASSACTGGSTIAGFTCPPSHIEGGSTSTLMNVLRNFFPRTPPYFVHLKPVWRLCCQRPDEACGCGRDERVAAKRVLIHEGCIHRQAGQQHRRGVGNKITARRMAGHSHCRPNSHYQDGRRRGPQG